MQFDIISNLNAGWHIDFTANALDPGPAEAEYVRMVRLDQDRGESDVCGPDYGYWVNPPLTDDGLGAIIDAGPGALWIVGNEPDHVAQDGMCPQQYAEAYHDVYHFIKNRDPSAQVAVAGLVEVTPARVQYLDIVWDSYLEEYGVSMPVDVWTMHIYLLSESYAGDALIALGTDPNLRIRYSSDCSDPNTYCHAENDDIDLFKEHVVRMRRWMERHGEQDKPLLLSEFSVVKPYHYEGGTCTVETCSGSVEPGCFCDENGETFHPSRVADFMEKAFDYLSTARDAELGYPRDGYLLVQQWLWYRLATGKFDEVGHASNLADRGAGFALTHQGQRWQDYVRAIPDTINLFPARVLEARAYTENGGRRADVTLTAEVMNDGNVAVSDPVVVRFYSDASLSAEIGSASFTDLGGCGRRVVRVETTWENLKVGAHRFWVKVDALESVGETDESDNVMRGVARVVRRRRSRRGSRH